MHSEWLLYPQYEQFFTSLPELKNHACLEMFLSISRVLEDFSVSEKPKTQPLLKKKAGCKGIYGRLSVYVESEFKCLRSVCINHYQSSCSLDFVYSVITEIKSEPCLDQTCEFLAKANW